MMLIYNYFVNKKLREEHVMTRISEFVDFGRSNEIINN
jgi:hypothetical protein